MTAIVQSRRERSISWTQSHSWFWWSLFMVFIDWWSWKMSWFVTTKKQTHPITKCISLFGLFTNSAGTNKIKKTQDLNDIQKRKSDWSPLNTENTLIREGPLTKWTAAKGRYKSQIAWEVVWCRQFQVPCCKLWSRVDNLVRSQVSRGKELPARNWFRQMKFCQLH